MYASAARRVVRWLMSRSVGLALAAGAIAVVGAPAASAATSTTTADGYCWLREYPWNVTCGGSDGDIGWLGVGYTQFGESVSFFGVSLPVPANALVSKATLRFDSSYGAGTSEITIGEVTGGLDAETTIHTFDTSNIDPLVAFTPTQTPTQTVDFTAVVKEWMAKGSGGASLAAYVEGGGGDPTYLDDITLEVEYDVPCPSNPYAAASVTSESIVHEWNQQLLERIRDASTTYPIRQSPTWISRTAAMLNVGIFDTMNSVYFAKLESLATSTPTTQVCGWESYLTLADTPANTNANLAAGYAAKAILTALYPDKSSEIATAFNTIHGTPSYDATAFALGNHIASKVALARASDGAGAGSYSPAFSTPGAWRPSPVGTGSSPGSCPAVTPQWGSVTPFAMANGSQFRPQLPGGYTTYSALLASSLYATNVDTVKNKGRYPRSSSTRTADEEEAAWFWANDLDGTYKPPGQLLQHTKQVIATQPAAQSSGDAVEFFRTWSREGIRVARLYAEVSLAMADAGIAAWDAKYNTPIDLWRPVDAIREGDTDGNASTPDIDAWEPLSRSAPPADVQFSPCFPAWISGHATFGGTWSRVMENEFAFADDHTNPFPLTLSTEDPHSKLPAPAIGFRSRTFGSFAAAAEENAASRIWLGVHYPFDASDGLATGRAVAGRVTSTRLRPAKTCASWSCATAIP